MSAEQEHYRHIKRFAEIVEEADLWSESGHLREHAYNALFNLWRENLKQRGINIDEPIDPWYLRTLTAKGKENKNPIICYTLF